MNVELPEEKKVDYDDARCKIDVGRLKKATSDKARVIIIKTIVNNFKMAPEHAIQFLEEIHEWQQMLNMTILLSYKLPEEIREEFCQQVMENKKICKFPEDKIKLQMFLDYEMKEKPKQEEEHKPIVTKPYEGDSTQKFKDI